MLLASNSVYSAETVSIGLIVSADTPDLAYIVSQLETSTTAAMASLGGALTIKFKLVSLVDDDVMQLAMQLNAMKVVAVLDVVNSAEMSFTVQAAALTVQIIHIFLHDIPDMIAKNSIVTLPGKSQVADKADASRLLLNALKFTQLVLGTEISEDGMEFMRIMDAYPDFTVTSQLYVSDIWSSVLN